MVIDVNFYCVNEDINNFIFNLLNQIIYKSNKGILLYSASVDKIKKFDEYLWTAGNDYDFLPHSVYADNKLNDDRFLLSNKSENSNNADNLILSSYIDNKIFLNSFNKILYVFTTMNNISVQQAKNSLNLFESMNYNIKINKKDNIKNNWSVVTTIA